MFINPYNVCFFNCDGYYFLKSIIKTTYFAHVGSIPRLLLYLVLNCCFFPAAAAADDDGKDSGKVSGKDAADSDAIIAVASDRNNGMGWDAMR